MYLAALDLFWRYELPKNQNTTKKKKIRTAVLYDGNSYTFV